MLLESRLQANLPMPDLFGCGTKRVWEDDRFGTKRMRRSVEDGSYLRHPYFDRDLFENGKGCLGKKRSRACDDVSPVDVKKRETAELAPTSPSFLEPNTDIVLRPHLSVHMQEGVTLDPTVRHRLFVEDALGADSRAMVPFRRAPTIVLNGRLPESMPLERPLTFPGELPSPPIAKPRQSLTIEEIDDDGDVLMEVERL